MALSEFTAKMVEKKLGRFCRDKIPEMYHHQVRLGFKIEGDIVTLYEERSMYCDPLTWINMAVAQFRYDEALNRWTLYYADSDFQWHLYYLKPKADFEILLREIDEDPIGVFWGIEKV